jgi:hypothetical protein
MSSGHLAGLDRVGGQFGEADARKRWWNLSQLPKAPQKNALEIGEGAKSISRRGTSCN